MAKSNTLIRRKRRPKLPPLSSFVNELFLPIEATETSQNYRSQIRRSVKLLEAMLEHPATLADLTADNLLAIEDVKADDVGELGDHTRKTLQKRLRAVWRYAAMLGYLDPPPHRLRPRRRTIESPPPGEGTLLADLETLVLESAIEESTESQYDVAIRCYGLFLGRCATREDLDEKTINRWLKSLSNRLGPTTIHNRKRGITRVWNWLADQGEVEYYHPRRLRRTRMVTRPVRAWSVDNIQRLLAGARDLEGSTHCDLQDCELARALILVAFDTGLRPGDVRRLHRDSVDTVERTITVVQNKTKNPHRAAIGTTTVDALFAIGYCDRPMVFPLTKATMRTLLDRLFSAAERHGFIRRTGQNLGTLRKSHATERARSESVEAAARSLGHVSGTKIALRHYVSADAIENLSSLACVDQLRPRNRVNDTPDA